MSHKVSECNFFSYKLKLGECIFICYSSCETGFEEERPCWKLA